MIIVFQENIDSVGRIKSPTDCVEIKHVMSLIWNREGALIVSLLYCHSLLDRKRISVEMPMMKM